MLIALGVVAGIVAAVISAALIRIIAFAIGNRGTSAIDHEKKGVRIIGYFTASASMIALVASPLVGLFVGITTCLAIIGG